MKIEFAIRPEAIAMVPPDFDLEAISGGQIVGWRDHRSGLAFEWENYDVVGTPDEFYLRLYTEAEPRKKIVSLRFDRVYRENQVVCYQVDRSRFEAELRFNRLAGHLSDLNSADSNDLFQFCLRAAQVCHLKPLRIGSGYVRVYPSAMRVDFRIVN